MADTEKILTELRRRANFPKDVPDRAWLIAIRYLLSQAADVIEEQEEEIARLNTKVSDAGWDLDNARQAAYEEHGRDTW